MQRSLNLSPRSETAGELDLGALGRLLKRQRRAVLVPTLIAFAAVSAFVIVVSPRYTAESQVLLENQETVFTRPDRMPSQSEQAALVDPEAVGSQVQLITSRDLARRAIRDLHFKGNPEFDPAARGLGPLTRVLVLLHLARDPTEETVDARLLQAFGERLSVYSPPKTRVITIQFQSKDAELAAAAANKLADLYIVEQSTAKRASAKAAADALIGQIAELRGKLAKADEDRERYRSESGLLAGTNNLTISGQQLADINGDLSRARAAQADSQAKATLLRELIRDGKTTDVTEVVNNDLVRRVGEQRVIAQAQLAQESRTLLPGHPRIKELTAQVSDLTAALKAAAKQAASTLENEARIAGTRVANLETVLAQQKKVAGAANNDEVRLRALDRIAQSYKDQLDSSTTKYQEALARGTSAATPADARIIARAVTPQEPSYPKKVPYIVFATVAGLVLSVGVVIARALLLEPASVQPVRAEPTLVAPPVPPVARQPDPPPAATPDPSAPVRPVVVAPVVVAPVVSSQHSAVADKRRRVARGGGLRSAVDGLRDTLRAFAQSAAAAREAAPSPPLPQATPVADSGVVPVPVGGVGWDGGTAPRLDILDAVSPPTGRRDRETSLHDLVARIIDAHLPGRGLHIVGVPLDGRSGEADDVLALGRTLAASGRAVVVDLNATPASLASLAGEGEAGARAVAALSGLSELLCGEASFAEVIHRDHASRLHFIPTGRDDPDYRDFDLILDALSETYDFVLLLAPMYPRSDIARVMAPYADIVALTASDRVPTTALHRMRAEIADAGAQDVFVIGDFVVPFAEHRPDVA